MNDLPVPEKRVNPGKLIRIIGSVIAVSLLIWLLIQQDWQEIGANVAMIGVPRFLLAVSLLMLSRTAISFRWYSLLRSAGQKVSYFSSLRLTFAGLFGNNFLPSTIGGDGIRLAGAIQSGWDGAISAASLVMDRLVGMAGMATFLPFSLQQILAYFNLGGLSSGSAFSLSALAPVEPPAEDQNSADKLINRVWRVFKRIWEMIVLWVKRPQTLIMPFLFTLAHTLFTFGMVWVILQGLNDPLPFLQVGGLWGLVYFISLLPISMGGIGLQDWAILFAFHQLGGITATHSLTFALLYRILMMFSSLPGAVFVPSILEKRKQAE